jgi:hypothetical protein
MMGTAVDMNLDPHRLAGRIHTVRDVQVMMDTDLAEIYGVETKVPDQAVKRNIGRFPLEFRFQLSQEEWEALGPRPGTLPLIPILSTKQSARGGYFVVRSGLCRSSSHYGVSSLLTRTHYECRNGIRSQPVTLKRGQHRKYLPYVFTEQGVAMLSTVLRSATAVSVSIQVMSAFVAMRRLMADNALIEQRLMRVERRQTDADGKFEQLFKALESRQPGPEKGLFFDGQVFDAWEFVSGLIRKAEQSIILIDNYMDDTVLSLLSKRGEGVTATIYTRAISRQMAVDLERHNAQYPAIGIMEFPDAHDRFLVIDRTALYHIGASLKDLGKKWFAFSKMDTETLRLLHRLDGRSADRLSGIMEGNEIHPSTLRGNER